MQINLWSSLFEDGQWIHAMRILLNAISSSHLSISKESVAIACHTRQVPMYIFWFTCNIKECKVNNRHVLVLFSLCCCSKTFGFSEARADGIFQKFSPPPPKHAPPCFFSLHTARDCAHINGRVHSYMCHPCVWYTLNKFDYATICTASQHFLQKLKAYHSHHLTIYPVCKRMPALFCPSFGRLASLSGLSYWILKGNFGWITFT